MTTADIRRMVRCIRRDRDTAIDDLINVHADRVCPLSLKPVVSRGEVERAAKRRLEWAAKARNHQLIGTPMASFVKLA